MKRQAKTRAWHHRHVHDPYVRQATQQGYRSRAAFKLIEIDDRDRLLKPGMSVVDLGCAPGGWCQVVAQRLKGQGRIVGVDLLPMTGLPGVECIQGDFTESSTRDRILTALGGRPADLVICDMAPNISGVAVADQARSYALAELALAFACRCLQPKGAFLVKLFQGGGFEEYMRALRSLFKAVQTRKPEASRDRSREVYLLARELRDIDRAVALE
ncbi:MAG: RlmE family RNA methyltransferase [Thiobacillaceae bacterium]